MKSKPTAIENPTRICFHEGRPMGIGVISHAQKFANASPLVKHISHSTIFVIRFLAFMWFNCFIADPIFVFQCSTLFFTIILN